MNRRAFRKADIVSRRTMLRDELLSAAQLGTEKVDRSLAFSGVTTGSEAAMLSFSDSMVENAVGFIPIPLGIATGFLIDGIDMDIALATEEPSVIAAASFAASMIARQGGFSTWASDPCMTAQVYIEKTLPGAAEKIRAAEGQIRELLRPLLATMEARGGGFRGLDLLMLPQDIALRVHLHIDVRDAMGANLLNTCAESLRPFLEELSGGSVLMAILSNQAAGRVAGARFSVPLAELSRGQWQGLEFAERIVKASRVAELDPARAITHNKGIMNGISALALATGNDTRAIEAAAHGWASRSGTYQSLSRYEIKDEALHGSLELPLPFATVGGATSVHPVAQMSRALLGMPSSGQLSRIAAALGLAQNYAALSALCGEGIQQGHMRLHERRLSEKNAEPPNSKQGT